MNKLQNNIVLVNGKKIHYKTIGPVDGKPVILIHGLSGSTRWWRRNIKTLALEYRLYLIDLPGFGSMRGSFGRVALEKASRWVVDVIHALGIQKANFIGHSMGGYICITLASEHPEVVDKLILVSSVGVPSGQTVFNTFIPLLMAMFYVTPRFLPILFMDALRAGPFSLLFSIIEVLRANANDKLHNITADTLLIWGVNDTLVPVKCAYQMKKEIKNAELVLLRYASHVPMYDEPDIFNQAVLKFLGKK